MKRPGRRGWTDYADVLRVVMDHPGTTSEIAARYGMAIRSVREVLYVMRDAGLICEHAWRKPSAGGRIQAVWSTQGPPAPRPKKAGWKEAPVPMPQLARFCRVVAALMAGAWTPADMADEVGASLNRVRPLLRQLRRCRLAYIERWRPTHGSWPVPVYRWGPHQSSAKSPKPRPESEAWRKQHQIRRQRLFWVHMIFLTAGAKPA
jgi:transcription initiation factor IIE alpha subunit